MNTSQVGTRQRAIDVARPDAVAGGHRRSKPKTISKNDLMPIMALVGAIYGWILVLLAVIVAAVVLLVR